VVPRLWDETIEAHRRAVRDATLHTTAALVAQHGLASVTMSQIAEQTGIGRATLYKYFPDVEAILVAWHERQIAGHLAQLAQIRDQAEHAGARLKAVLEAYALIVHDHHGSDLAALLHRGATSPTPNNNSTSSSGTCCGRAQPAARSAMTSHQRSWRPTASMRSRQPATCPPGPRSAGWSGSSWLAYSPHAKSL